MSKQANRGFTVVEVIVIVIVIAILATITVVAYSKVQAEARDQKRRTDIINLANELDKYFASNGDYPLSCDPAISFNCSSVATSYTSSTGTPAPPVISPSSSLSTIKAILPGINDNFGDPKHGSDNLINVGAPNNTLYLKPTTYYFLSLNAWNLGASSYFRTDPTYSAYQSCSYSAIGSSYQGVSRSGYPHPYVLGYFSEVQNKWIYLHGPKGNTVNNLRWNYDNKAACNPVSSLSL